MLLGIGKRFEAAQTTASWVDRVLMRRTAPKDSTCLSALPWTPALGEDCHRGGLGKYTRPAREQESESVP